MTDRESPVDHFAFLHIPKTGGRTVTEALRSSFAETDICTRQALNLHRSRSKSPPTHYRLFAGHFDRSDLDDMPPGTQAFTFLREPRARLLSNYYFWRSFRRSTAVINNLIGPQIARSQSLLEFLTSNRLEVIPTTDNMMTRFLAGRHTHDLDLDDDELIERAFATLDSLVFVGITERLHDDVPRLFEALGLGSLEKDLDQLWAQAQEQESDFVDPITEREPITPDIAEALDHRTRLDRILYDWGASVLENSN